MTADMQHVLGCYVQCGLVNASYSSPDDKESVIERSKTRPAYLLLSSLGTCVQPLSEVLVTAVCWRAFRAHKMVVAEDSGRFKLTDLKIGFRSQFLRAQDIPLRDHVALVRGLRPEVKPDLIRWPLDLCAYGSEVSARAILSEGQEAEFEILLLGEAVT